MKSSRTGRDIGGRARLVTVRLELARNPGFPEGAGDCGYEIRVPLDEGGHIDLASFNADREACTVRRFWRGEDEQFGKLEHGRHGWAFSYGPGEEDDEPLYKLDSHVLKVGEYETIREYDGPTYTFRIARIV
jgi:hypothetical protein